MHPNPVFRQTPTEQNLEFVREHAFGTLAINAPDGPLLAHIPFVLGMDGTTVDLHLVRSNPILRALGDGQQAVLSVIGPHSYISPDWYGVDDLVPTWNYVAVHLRGRLERLPEADLPGLLDTLAAQFETRLLPKPPWLAGKMGDGVAARMMRMIAPCRMQIETVDGTWKLGQNKPAEARRLAADGVEGAGIGADLAELAALMRGASDG